MNRRDLLKTAALATATLPLVEGARVHAAPRPSSKNFVLVHGAWHHSLHWARVAQYLVAMGHRVDTVDLPGHGLHARFPASYLTGDKAQFEREPSPLRNIRLEEGAQAVIDVLKAPRPGPRPILVGHSMGGTMLTQVGEQAPELIGRLVYLSAYCPLRLKSSSAYATLPEAKTGYGETLFIGDPDVVGVFRINPRGDATYLEALRAAYYQDVEMPAFLPFALALTPDLPSTFFTTEVHATRERWGRLPRTYLRCAQDRALAPALQDLMIREADAFTPGNRFEQKTLETSHSPFASQPEQLARLLAGLR